MEREKDNIAIIHKNCGGLMNLVNVEKIEYDYIYCLYMVTFYCKKCHKKIEIKWEDSNE